MKEFRTSAMIVAAIAGTTVSGYGAVVNFNNSANVNVLRDYHANGLGQPVNQVTETQTTNGGLIQYGYGNDGSDKPDAWTLTNAQSATATFPLPAPAQVSSYSVQIDDASLLPGTLTLEGLVSGVWTPLDTTFSPVAGVNTRTFATQTVTQLRYSVTGRAAGSTNAFVHEFQVFMPTGLTVPAGSFTDAYNFLHDNGVTSAGSTTGGPWQVPLGTASQIYDGTYQQNTGVSNHTASTASFVILNLTADELMNAMHLGWMNGQTWAVGCSIYTAGSAQFSSLANAASVTQALSSASATDIMGAGWVQQFTTSASVPVLGGIDIGFTRPGSYQYVMIEWPSNGAGIGYMGEAELFATIPEPAMASLWALTALTVVIRSRRARR